MLGKIFKPKWQHQDAEIRKSAIDGIDDQELLVRLARGDSSQSVQEAAVLKLRDLNHLLELYHEPQTRPIAQTRIREILLQSTKNIHYSAALGSYLVETADSEIIEHVLTHSKDPQIQSLAIECSQNPETLYKLCVESESSDIRFTAARKLEDEFNIRRAIKALGKRDKRVAKQLREKLEQINQKKKLSAEFSSMLDGLDRLGEDTNWQHDQARHEKLQQQWGQEFAALADDKQTTQWKNASTLAEQRLKTLKKESERIQPILDHMVSLSDVTSGFVHNLNNKPYLRKSEADELTNTLDSFEHEWNGLPDLDNAEARNTTRRFKNSLAECRQLIETLQQNALASKHFESLITEAEKLLKKAIVSTRKVEDLTAQWGKLSLPKDKTLADSLEKDFNNLNNQLSGRLRNQQDKREQELKNIHQWLDSLDHSLTQDQTTKATKLFHKIEQHLKQVPECPREERQSIEKVLSDYRPRLRELEGWRHWSTDRVRESLIDEACKLINNSGITINERAKTIRELRTRWKKLGKIDPKSGRKLWEKFDAACNEAYQPVRENQEQQAELRNKNLSQRESICQQLEDIVQNTDWNSPAWRDIDKHFNQLRTKWRNAGAVNRKKWNAINERFNQAQNELDSHLENERRVCMNRRLALIDRVEQAQDIDDLTEAKRIATQAQKDWHPTVTGKRHEEQKLWKRFRRALDVIYERDKSRREEDASSIRSLIEQKQKICDAMEQLTHLKNDELINAYSQSQKLVQEWETAESVRNKEGRKLDQRFEKITRLFNSLHATEQRQRKKRLIVRHLDGNCIDTPDTSEQDIKTLLLELEIILEIESPESESDARMQLQVERLADAMSQHQSTDELDELMSLAKLVCPCLRNIPAEESIQLRLEKIKQATLAV